MTGKAASFAPAKINLTLHVTGRRADGYHLLDSLVVFADVGDQVSATASENLSLTVDGAMAQGVPTDSNNLMLKAAALMAKGQAKGAALHLHKCLPASSGIGGGSSDAAATLRVLAKLWNCPIPSTIETLALGADLPVCMDPYPQRMSNIGETVEPLQDIPTCPVVLVNPGVAVSTPTVFKAMHSRENTPMPKQIPSFESRESFFDWLARQRNDLEPAAVQSAPIIGETLQALKRLRHSRLARMSGSGATCFALFSHYDQAALAAKTLRAEFPTWWVAQGKLHGSDAHFS